MADLVDSITRSRMMAAVKSSNTKPELQIRSILHKRGFRYRLHVKNLPGKPDIVLPKYRSVIFINGCFWHGHENCRFFKLPTTRTDFWKEKISRNKNNDSNAIAGLLANNWKVCIIWQCKIRESKKDLDALGDIISNFIMGKELLLELRDNY
ncbi:very short patch repair endonuclease [Acinetobacter pittii]|uniref:very short patch repair endonuclease n=1 Tax=Acinetobacter pittii TaxID=48296 RepID=UPI001581290D|nr:DNA mismatch endonuclease Vsr [Acinetobacter pittii]NUF43032.1 DNA mismatch endonuclease Vsr [Acinetobacter pittii]